MAFGLVALLGFRFRAELAGAGRWLVDHLGYPGMGFGTFLADGLHFPIPPQFYMLAAIVCPLRAPKIVAYSYLIAAGWHL